MKTIIVLLILTGLVLAATLSLRIVDVQTSMKYEVSEPRAMGLGDSSLDEKERIFNDALFWYRLLLGYLGLNVASSGYLLYKITRKEM